MSAIDKRELTAALVRIADLLDVRGQRGYIVGGFIRDWLLERKTHDIDIAVSCDPVTIGREVAQAVGGTFVLLDKANGIVRVVLAGDGQNSRESPRAEWHFDFSPFSGDIGSDLGRRDFTINAMALELRQFVSARTGDNASPGRAIDSLPADRSAVKLIDPFSGRQDLSDKLVRAISTQVFQADAARLLRAVRLAAELGFAIEPETERSMRQCSRAISEVPGERVREELVRLLRLPGAAGHLRYLDSLGLLLTLIPELAAGKGVDQPTVHFWDVFEHSVQTVAALEFLVRESNWEHGRGDMLAAAPWSDAIDSHLSREVSSGSTHRVLLKLGALLHDVAKPMTKSVDDTGRARFLGHTKQGAAMTASILERLRFSNREIRLVESLVYHHLRPVQMANGELPTRRAVYRYFRDTGKAGIDVLLLALADYLASRGPLASVEEWTANCRLMNHILAEHDAQQARTLPVKLIDGHDIMHAFELGPGPLVGELLVMVNEAYASGELTTREEALALVRRRLAASSKQQDRITRNAGSPEVNRNLTKTKVD
ncbi:MAG: CCA tRNA nucleotidyltransferase [Dehalococcoidia bacterium]|nr:CCA tRNA nucleotidyltransferase [Dehalococcoidia bacterium]